MLKQKREGAKSYSSRESHYFLGKRYLLKVLESDRKSSVLINHCNIILNVRPNFSIQQRQILLQEFYRKQLKEISLKMIRNWEKKMNVKVADVGVRKMKTRWGSCNQKLKKIHLNLELAKKPLQCLEYIIVHEMTHLLERKHNEKFIAYMNKFLPNWKSYKEELNRLPAIA